MLCLDSHKFTRTAAAASKSLVPWFHRWGCKRAELPSSAVGDEEKNKTPKCEKKMWKKLAEISKRKTDIFQLNDSVVYSSLLFQISFWPLPLSWWPHLLFLFISDNWNVSVFHILFHPCHMNKHQHCAGVAFSLAQCSAVEDCLFHFSVLMLLKCL